MCFAREEEVAAGPVVLSGVRDHAAVGRFGGALCSGARAIGACFEVVPHGGQSRVESVVGRGRLVDSRCDEPSTEAGAGHSLGGNGLVFLLLKFINYNLMLFKVTT